MPQQSTVGRATFLFIISFFLWAQGQLFAEKRNKRKKEMSPATDRRFPSCLPVPATGCSLWDGNSWETGVVSGPTGRGCAVKVLGYPPPINPAKIIDRRLVKAQRQPSA